MVVCSDPFPASYIACHPERGCLTALDCDVACEKDLEFVVDCAGDFAPCEADGDCGAGRCLLGDGATTGDCTDGTTGAPCLDDDDCVAETCVAVALDGEHTCQSGENGSSCNEASDCASGLAG